MSVPEGYVDEVERCYGVRPRRTPEEQLEATHRALDDALPPGGLLGERYQTWREGDPIPTEHLEPLLNEVSADLRARTAELVGLPDGESAVIELVSDEPWAAYNYYEGGLRSRIAVNTDIPMAPNFITDLMAHELYPGHQTEHSWKEQVLYRDRGGVAGNVALMLYEDGASEDDAFEYLCHWALMSERRANQALRFITDPMWRPYVTTYADGYRVCRDWVDGDPSRFKRLLTEQLTPADLSS